MTVNKELMKKKHPYDGKVIVDKLGRSITLRRPRLSEKMNLNAALGSDYSKEGCRMYAMFLPYIAKIDDMVFPTILNKAGLDSNLDLLEEEGLEAVIEEMLPHLTKTEEEAIEEVKK